MNAFGFLSQKCRADQVVYFIFDSSINSISEYNTCTNKHTFTVTYTVVCLSNIGYGVIMKLDHTWTKIYHSYRSIRIPSCFLFCKLRKLDIANTVYHNTVFTYLWTMFVLNRTLEIGLLKHSYGSLLDILISNNQQSTIC